MVIWKRGELCYIFKRGTDIKYKYRKLVQWIDDCYKNAGPEMEMEYGFKICLQLLDKQLSYLLEYI